MFRHVRIAADLTRGSSLCTGDGPEAWVAQLKADREKRMSSSSTHHSDCALRDMQDLCLELQENYDAQ